MRRNLPWNLGRWYFFGIFLQEHLDKAIELLPEEPLLYYLNGRYCYAVSWIFLSINLIWVYSDCMIYFQWLIHSFIVLPIAYYREIDKNITNFEFIYFIIYIFCFILTFIYNKDLIFHLINEKVFKENKQKNKW